MSLLNADEIESAATAIVDANLWEPSNRLLLLGGIRRDTVLALPVHAAPASQLRSDITELSGFTGGVVDRQGILRWLNNAASLSRNIPDASTVLEGLAKVVQQRELANPLSLRIEVPLDLPEDYTPPTTGEEFREMHRAGQRFFARANLPDASLDNMDLSGCNFREANLRLTSLVNCSLRNSDLRDADLSSANLRGARLEQANLFQSTLRGAALDGAKLCHCNLNKSDMRSASLPGTDFRGAHLIDANLNGASADYRTRLEETEMNGVCLQRRFLTSLDDQCGGIHRSQLLQMTIDDPIAEMRVTFGGIGKWLYAFAAITYFTPFLIHAVILAVQANAPHMAEQADASYFSESGGEIRKAREQEYLASALVRYSAYRESLLPKAFGPLIFGYLLLVQIARILLIKKADDLEAWERVTELPTDFELTGAWLWLYRFHKYGIWLSVPIAIRNAWLLAIMEVPKAIQ